MQANDLFSDRKGLQQLLTTFRAAGRELGMSPSDLAGLSGAVGALSGPAMVMVLGTEGSGKTSLVSALLGEELLDLKDLSAPMIVVWKYGEHATNYEDSDFVECYRPNSLLKDLEFIEIQNADISANQENIKRVHLIADVVLLVFTAMNPWDAEGFNFVSDLRLSGERSVAVVVTHTDQRTKEETHAVAEYLSVAGKKALLVEIPVYKIPSSGILKTKKKRIYPDSAQGEGDLEALRIWIDQALQLRKPLAERRARAESVLVSVTHQIAKLVENTAERNDVEKKCLVWFKKEVALSRKTSAKDLADQMEQSLVVFDSESEIVRNRLKKSISFIGVPCLLLIGFKWFFLLRKCMADTVAGDVEQAAKRGLVRTEDRVIELDRCFEEKTINAFGEDVSILIKGNNEKSLFSYQRDEICQRAGVNVMELITESEISTVAVSMLSLRRVLIAVFLPITVGLVWFLQLQEETLPFSFPLVLGATFGLMFVIIVLRAMKDRTLAYFGKKERLTKQKIEKDLSRFYSIQIESVYRYHEDAAQLMRDICLQRAARRARSSNCISGAVKTAKQMLAKSSL